MTNSHKKKSEKLGINYSTASAKLRKQILFKLVQQCNLDECFKCKTKIENLEELSIEHKLNWYVNGVEYFWDLDNIAFSHLKCNRPDFPSCGRGHKRRIEPPEGKAWCSTHKDFLPRENFDKGARWDGLKGHCKECRSSRHKLGLGR